MTTNNTNRSNNSFTIYKNNILLCDANGNASITIDPSTIMIPSDTIKGLPSNSVRNISDLISTIGTDKINLTYSVSANGFVSKHDCWCTYNLYVNGELNNGIKLDRVLIASTKNDPNNGNAISSGWMVMQPSNTSSIIVKLSANGSSDGTQGCQCNFQSYGGWKGVYISLKIDIIMDLMSYCTSGQNINQDVCFDYIGNYINTYGPTPNISNYLSQYCAQKYPDSSIEMWQSGKKVSERDREICACSLPSQEYADYYSKIQSKIPSINIGTNPAACLLPACNSSRFKTVDNNKCMIPTCLHMSADGKVTVDPSVNCTAFGIPLASEYNPAPGSNINITTKPKSTNAPQPPSYVQPKPSIAYSQPPSYNQPPTYAQPSPYAQPPTYTQPPLYNQYIPHNQHSPIVRPNRYAQPVSPQQNRPLVKYAIVKSRTRTFWDKYKWWIVIIVFILMILMIGVVYATTNNGTDEIKITDSIDSANNMGINLDKNYYYGLD